MSKGSFIILMYHRVISRDKIDSTVQPGMFVLPETLKMHIDFLMKNFTIAPLKCLKNDSTIQSEENKPRCFLTFDDGWKDFLENAFSVLELNKTYATVFLATGYVGTEKWFWPDRLISMMNRIDKIKNGKIFSNDEKDYFYNVIEAFKRPFVDRSENAIKMLKRLGEDDIEKILSAYSSRWNISFESPERAFLSWDEVCRLKKTGHVDFGSHTLGHKILTTLESDAVKYELEESKRTLLDKKVMDGDFCSFCYPSGIYGETYQKYGCSGRIPFGRFNSKRLEHKKY